jgi:1-acyl-sn-glycerol-3-phosphate acyltransferase
MRTIFLWVYFAFYMLISIFLRLRLAFIKKYGTKEQAEKFVYKFASNCAKSIINKAGVKVNIIGKENLPKEACLFVPNHQGLFDLLLLLGYINRPIGFIAKKETENIPIISGWMKEMHCVFIDRKNTREGLKAINQGVENLKEGHSMVIFPEGTRSRSSYIGEFKKGSMRLAIRSECPIVPITIDGTYKVFEANHGMLKPGIISLIINKPIYAKNFTMEEQGNLSNIVRAIIKENLPQR